MKEKPTYFDFLRLTELDLEGHPWIIFVGVSGSGKSTAMQWLQENRPDPKRIVIDEIQTALELRRLIRSRTPRCTYLIASHVPIWQHRLIRPLDTRQKILQTDQNRGQLEAWLTANEFTFSERAIKAFTGKYGASFVDLEFIARSCPIPDFDTAFHQFEKLQRIERTPGA